MDVERLKALSSASRFTDWEGFVASEKIVRCRAILREAALRLLQHPQATPSERVAILYSAVHQLNAADDGFINTIERDEICDQIAEIGKAASLSATEIDDALDERDW